MELIIKIFYFISEKLKVLPNTCFLILKALFEKFAESYTLRSEIYVNLKTEIIHNLLKF